MPGICPLASPSSAERARCNRPKAAAPRPPPGFASLAASPSARPRLLRDLLWSVARVNCRNGPRGEVFLPVLYPGAHREPDDQVRLGRMTGWQDAGDEFTVGVGQRLFMVDGEDRAMLEMRTIEFEGA